MTTIAVVVRRTSTSSPAVEDRSREGEDRTTEGRSRGGQTSAVASQSMMPITSSTSEIDPSSSQQQQTCSVLSSLGNSTFDYSQSLSLKPDHVNIPLWITRDHTIYLGEWVSESERSRHAMSGGVVVLSNYLSIHLLSIYASIHTSIYISIHPSIHPSICSLSIYLSHLSIHLSIV